MTEWGGSASRSGLRLRDKRMFRVSSRLEVGLQHDLGYIEHKSSGRALHYMGCQHLVHTMGTACQGGKQNHDHRDDVPL